MAIEVTNKSISGVSSLNSVSDTELSSLDGVTSSLQSQIDASATSDSPTFTGNVTLPSTTSIGSVTDTEISHLSGLSSGAQGQIDLKADLDNAVFKGGSYTKLRVTSDRRVVEYLNNGFGGGYRISLGAIPWHALSGENVHIKVSVNRSTAWMVGFSVYGYGYSSTCVVGNMIVYMYPPQSTPYNPVYVNLGNSGGFVNCYYASDDQNLVVVIDKNSSSYTGAHMYYWTAGSRAGNDSVAILAMAGSGSTSGVY